MPEAGDIWIHKRKGTRYFIMRLIKRRRDSDFPDKWETAVLYCKDVDDIHEAQWYARSINDFALSFEKED